ncbi:hypothetical protein [Aurantimonas sp. VKM B-3413]|nr:hypothetical protein [Aurantimonas sp. VKM B-3413]
MRRTDSAEAMTFRQARVIDIHFADAHIAAMIARSTIKTSIS